MTGSPDLVGSGLIVTESDLVGTYLAGGGVDCDRV